MKAVGINLMIIHALFFALWFIAQQGLFAQGMTPAAVLVWSGVGAAVLIAFSLIRHRKIPSRQALPWLLATIVANIFIAEFLVKTTQEYGASLGANAMALAPVAAVLVGWITFRELPGWRGIAGIITIFLGIYLLHTEFNAEITSFLVNIPASWLIATLVIAVSAGSAIVFIKPVIKTTDPLMAPGLVLFVSFGLYGLLKLAVNGSITSLAVIPNQATVGLILLVIIGIAVSNWAQAKAYHYTFAASVGALKRLSIPLTVILSWIFFGPTATLPSLLLGSLVIFCGAFLIGIDKKKLPEPNLAS